MHFVTKFTTLAVLSGCFLTSAAAADSVANPQTPLSQVFWGYVFPILLSLVFVVYGAVSAFAHLRLQAAAKTSKVAAAVDQFLASIDHAVAHVNSDIRPTLASGLADGSLSPEEGALLKRTAIEIAAKQLLPETLELIKGQLGEGFATWVSGAIETALLNQQAIAAEKAANAVLVVTEVAPKASA